MKKWLLLAVCLGIPGMVFAEMFRIDIVGKNIGMAVDELGENVTGAQAGWMKEKCDQRLLFVGPAGRNQWEKRTFSFTPKQDGRVEVVLMGNINKPGAPLIDYDVVTVNGKLLPNGGFEESVDGKLSPWWGSGVLKSDGGAEGRNYLRANHVQPVGQGFAVKAGVPVKIAFQTRDAGR